MAPGSKAVTELLAQWSNGNAQALDELIPLLYGQMRSLARRELRSWGSGQTLQPTALVHELYLKMAARAGMPCQNRNQFFGLAAQIIRNILVDHARSRNSFKRGGGLWRIELETAVETIARRDIDLLRLDDALLDLAARDRRQSQIVEMRYFGGLTIEETAELLGISPATAKRDWMVAKAWLYRELSSE